MILHDKPALKLLITELDSQLSRSSIKIKRSRLYEILAQSQGFKTKAALVSRLPIFLDTSNIATDVLLVYIERYDIKSDSSTHPNSSLLENAACIVQPFPLVAPPHSGLKLSIDWDYGFVYRPYHCEPTGNSGTWDEFYRRSSSFMLNSIVLEDEYGRLRELIDPSVQQVVAGYTNNGPEEKASFTKAADEALERVGEIIDNFEFEFWGGLEPGHPADLFGDYIVYDSDVEELELTEVVVEGALLLDHSYSDIDLRCLVATELKQAFAPANDESLYCFLKSLRDACKRNYDAKSRAVTIA